MLRLNVQRPPSVNTTLGSTQMPELSLTSQKEFTSIDQVQQRFTQCSLRRNKGGLPGLVKSAGTTTAKTRKVSAAKIHSLQMPELSLPPPKKATPTDQVQQSFAQCSLEYNVRTPLNLVGTTTAKTQSVSTATIHERPRKRLRTGLDSSGK